MMKLRSLQLLLLFTFGGTMCGDTLTVSAAGIGEIAHFEGFNTSLGTLTSAAYDLTIVDTYNVSNLAEFTETYDVTVGFSIPILSPDGATQFFTLADTTGATGILAQGGIVPVTATANGTFTHTADLFQYWNNFDVMTRVLPYVAFGTKNSGTGPDIQLLLSSFTIGGTVTYTYAPDAPAPAPEPSSMALFGSASLGLGLLIRNKR